MHWSFYLSSDFHHSEKRIFTSAGPSQINCTRNAGLTLIKRAFDLKMISLIKEGPPLNPAQ